MWRPDYSIILQGLFLTKLKATSTRHKNSAKLIYGVNIDLHNIFICKMKKKEKTKI